MELETKIAQAHWTNVENRDRDKTYNKYNTIDFEKETSNFKWQKYLKDAMVKENNEIVVYQPSYFRTLGKLFQKESVESLPLCPLALHGTAQRPFPTRPHRIPA